MQHSVPESSHLTATPREFNFVGRLDNSFAGLNHGRDYVPLWEYVYDSYHRVLRSLSQSSLAC